MIAALDLGTSEFRSLRRDGARLVARRLPAVYTVLDDSEPNRRLLEQSQISYSLTADSLVIVGEAAGEMATLLSKPLVPLLQEGSLGDRDPIGRQVVAWLIDLLLPQAQSAEDICMMTLPRGETSVQGADNWTCQFLEHIVQLRGYKTTVMNPATALGLAELDSDEFTGVSMTFGAESTTFSLTHHSQPLVEARFRRGLDGIIELFAREHKKLIWDGAGNSYLDIQGVHRWLKSGRVSLSSPRSEQEVWLRDALQEMLLSTWFGLKRKLLHCHETITRQPMPIVISGAPTQLPGFSALVLESLRLSGTAIHPSEIRVASFEPYSVVRGLLIQATLTSGMAVSEMEKAEAA
ncbi:hypothetical protein [Planctomicrobium sp. SH527]|uniref:hypothetical protein n=1 Tax=Planctomicrobium sp. SH527 TaxID=3448123 RepID=UPI003F5C6B25